MEDEGGKISRSYSTVPSSRTGVIRREAGQIANEKKKRKKERKKEEGSLKRWIDSLDKFQWGKNILVSFDFRVINRFFEGSRITTA